MAESFARSEKACERFFWALQGVNYNVYGIVSATGDLVERYEYTPYGRRTVYSRGWLKCDFDGDGSVGSSDKTRFTDYLNNDPTAVVAEDVSGDGVVSFADFLEFQGAYGQSVADDPLVMHSRLESFRTDSQCASAGGYGSLCDIGHQGLLHDKEFGPASTGLVHNRARTLNPHLGRFMQRDPLGYVDGMGLYEYCRSGPTNLVDWTGFEARSSLRCEFTLSYGVYKTEYRGSTDVTKKASWTVKASIDGGIPERTDRGLLIFPGEPNTKQEARVRRSGGIFGKSGMEMAKASEVDWAPQGTFVRYKVEGVPIVRSPNGRTLFKEEQGAFGKAACVECYINVVDVKVTIEKKMPTYVKEMATLARIATSNVKLKVAAWGLSLITPQEVLTVYKNHKVRAVLVVCADGRSAVGVYNIPSGSDPSWTGAERRPRRLDFYRSWIWSTVRGNAGAITNATYEVENGG